METVMISKNTINCQERVPSAIFDGTYSFCAECRKEDNCCVRVTPNGRISRPVLFTEDVERIEQYTGNDCSTFSTGHNSFKRGLKVMKADNNGCYFCRSGECAIYLVRPLDCRLFPFDVMEKDSGSLVWIAYTKTCSVAFDIFACLEQAKCLLPQLKNKILDYARADAPWMSGEPYVELGTIEIP